MPVDTPAAGATPVVDGATPAQTTPVSPAAAPAAPATPATDDAAALGDAGKRALDVMKAERDAAKRAASDAARALEELQNASKSEHERALDQAKKAGAAEISVKLGARIRHAEVRSGLTAAGMSAPLVDLAVLAPEFAALKVTDDGEVQGLEAAVEAFKKARADLFAKPGAAIPDYGGGPRGTPAAGGTDMNTIIRRAAGRA